MSSWQETFKTENATFRVRKEYYKTITKNGILLDKLTDSGWENLEKKPLGDFHDKEDKARQMAWAYRQWDKFYRNGDIVESSYNPPIRVSTDIDELIQKLNDEQVRGFYLGDTHHAWWWNHQTKEDVMIAATPAHEHPYKVPYAIQIDGMQHPLHEKRIKGELTVEKYVEGLKKAIEKAEVEGLLQ